MAPAEQPLLKLEGLSFSYPGKAQKVLQGINLTLQPGEALLVTGPTGCGKSTLLKTINGIIPLESSGLMEGVVRLQGIATNESTLAELAPKVGLVFQSPDDQLFCGSVYDEVAFGPQMLGLGQKEVEDRVNEALQMVGLKDKAGGQPFRLSGGQKQRLAIACQLAMHPLVLALDEPISQLDPKGCFEVMTVLAGLRERGLAIVLVEHRLTDALKLATRVALMDRGRIVAACTAEELDRHTDLLAELGLKIPDQIMERQFLAGLPAARCLHAGIDNVKAGKKVHDEPRNPRDLVRLENVSFTYDRAKRPALDNISLSIRRNETLAVVGANGSGKSTLLGILAGQLQPAQGNVTRRPAHPGFKSKDKDRPRTALLFQNPDLLLIESSLARQLTPPGKNSKKQKDQALASARELARRMGLEKWLPSPPWALSKGQRLRAALGSLLSSDPDLLLLDEPTTGQNQLNIHRLLAEVLGQPGLKAVVICSHDLECVYRFAHRVAVLDRGRLVEQGPVEEVIPKLVCRTDFCPTPPLAVELSRRLKLDPPLPTMDSLFTFLSESEGAGS